MWSYTVSRQSSFVHCTVHNNIIMVNELREKKLFTNIEFCSCLIEL